jgi:uncharacterized protein (DUF433 family)
MDYHQLITIEPGKRGGKPCIRGLRITVSDVLEYLASGMSEDDLLRDFPDLTRDDIRACLAFAAERERRLMATSGK